MLGEKLGKPFIVDNRGGGGGNIGAAAVAKSPADGYTLLFSTNAPIVQNPMMYRNMQFKPDRDLQPIVLISGQPVIIGVRANSPFKTLHEFIDYAKANPGKLNVGVPGQGTLGHVTCELLQNAAGIKLTSVPYRGSTQIIADLLGGQIDAVMDSMSIYVPLVTEGKLVALATTGTERSPNLPNVPTVMESRVADFEAYIWNALMAPAGTPKEVVQAINTVVNSWLKTDQAKEVLATMSMQAKGGSPDELKAYIASEVAKWGPVIKAANIQF